MKSSRFVAVFLLLLALSSVSSAQTKRKRPIPQKKAEARRSLVVVDERLSAVRAAPSLFARPVRRVKRGKVFPLGEAKSSDGVLFFRVALSSRTSGWVQAHAFVVRGKPGEDARLLRLINSSSGFERIDRARIFLEAFPDSSLRPVALLLTGDILEEAAAKLSKDLARRLRKSEMSASGAPLRSFYLGNVSLDRYVRLGFGFVFNESTVRLHYDGRAWREIVSRFPDRPEAVEAAKRLERLGQ